MIARALPLAGVGVFFAVGFVFRAWLHYHRHGRWGVILFRSADWRQHLRDILFLVLLIVLAGESVAAAARPTLLSSFYLFPFSWAERWVALGAILLVAGNVLMVAAQLNLGSSWRIGIEEEASPGLVTGGLYQICRNPIFLGMFVVLAGLAALMPTWISAVVALMAVACVRSQVLEEEAYLTACYGDAYRAYTRRVGRFVPRLVKPA